MSGEKFRIAGIGFLLGLIAVASFPGAVLAEDILIIDIKEARLAIEQARKAGAEQSAYDEFSSAQLWLFQAEQAYSGVKSVLSILSTAKMKKAKEEEVLYLAAMARLKALTAEAKAKKAAAAAELNDVRKDVASYRNALNVIKSKWAEAEQAKEIQTKAQAERRQLEEAQRKVAEIEAQRKKELEAVQEKAAHLDALKEKELREAQLKEAQRAAERAKEIAESELMSLRRSEAEAEMKAKEAKLLAEKQAFAALQTKVQSLEREKALLGEAGKIRNVAVRTAADKIVMTILVSDLFTSANDLKPSGKDILNRIGNLIRVYGKKAVMIRGHADSQGKPASNQALSERRAQKVREYLVAYENIAAGQVAVEGVGSAEPVATNATEGGRALNRRVEISLPIGE